MTMQDKQKQSDAGKNKAQPIDEEKLENVVGGLGRRGGEDDLDDLEVERNRRR